MKQRVLSRQILRSVMAVSLACSMILPGLASKHDKRDKDHKRETKRGDVEVTTENFGQVNDHIYRGGQPKGDNYNQLTSLGVQTIIDLRGDAEQDARANAERAGLRYINLPLEPKRYPQADAATRFLELVNDQANWPVYVHCAGGRHRTGSMIAVYRMMMDNWTVDQAYKEMKQYDFYTSWGHGCYKDFVYDYYRDLLRQPSRQVQVASDVQLKNRAQGN